MDNRIDKLADLLVNYSVEVKPGEKVVIQGTSACEPMLRALYTKVVQAGGNPFLLVSLPGTDELLYRYGNDDQLRHVPEPFTLVYKTYDCRIAIGSSLNTREMSGVNPAKMVLRSQARTELMKVMMKRTASGEFRWVGALFPTNAYAQDAEMSLSDYEDFVYNACMPDLNDPVGYWKKMDAWQAKIVKWLEGRKSVHVKGKETDLRLSIEGRKFMNCNGKLNMPDGEVYTGPVENSAEGYVYFSYPAIENGREVTGVRLWFEKGKCVQATADKNLDFLNQTLDTDAGSRYLGEFAIGTNEGIQKFTREILFDEKIGGSFHMALGAGYPETGSKNESAIHWDMVCDLRDGGEIWVDDILLYKNGKFVIEF
jgi:aminopeptidase